MKWVIGVAALAVAVTVIAASFSGTVEPFAPDETLLRLFPADSGGLLYADVSGLLEKELVQEFFVDGNRSRIPEAIEEFSIQTGLDPFADVEQVMLGRTGSDAFLGVARVDYDLLNVQQYFRDRDVAFDSYAGRSLYQSDSDEDWRVSFVDDLVLMGDEVSVQRAIDRLGAPAPTVLDDLRLVDGIESIEEGSQIWAVGNFSDIPIPTEIAPPMAVDLIGLLESGTYQMRWDSGISMRVVGKFTTSENARRTTDLLRGLVAFGKMQVFEEPDLIELLDGVRIDTVESSVEIRFALEAELLGRITELGLPFPVLSDE